MIPDWIQDVKQKAPRFLASLHSKRVPGFFHYSLSGDLYGEDINWGLGNTVFAVKSYYTLGIEPDDKNAMASFIKSFQNPTGHIVDPLIRRKAFWREKIIALKNRSLENMFHKETARAETRQAISALALLGTEPDIYPNVPSTTAQIDRYLSQLNWYIPWGAGSHFSHLLFLLSFSTHPDKESLMTYAVNWVNNIQNPKTGSWFKGTPSLTQQINGAMKVLTGLKAAHQMTFNHAHKLIDLALSATNNRQACDHFNVIYVLKYANEMTEGTYRQNEIKQFAQNRLQSYREYYFPEHGGFSFYKGKARRSYYGARITKGLNEPDIHGTVLFLWGIALIAQILEFDQELKFKEFIT
jgi:hypothetical protein